MKRLIRSCAVAAVMVLPFAALAQNDGADQRKAPTPAPGMMMACPMMGNMDAMHKDVGAMVGEVETMMKDAKDPAQKDRLQRMHDRMTAMMAGMQKMSAMHSMMGMMKGSGMAAPAAPAQKDVTPDTSAPNSTAPVSPEDHKAHHPAP